MTTMMTMTGDVPREDQRGGRAFINSRILSWFGLDGAARYRRLGPAPLHPVVHQSECGGPTGPP